MTDASLYFEFVRQLLVEYLATATPFSVKEENVFIGETEEFLMKPDTFYPRVELQMAGAPSKQFVTQRIRERELIFSVQGFIRRPVQKYEKEDMYNLIDFAIMVEDIIFKTHNAKLAGDPRVPANFIKLSAMTEVIVAHEFEPKISMFIFNFTADFSVGV
jgi:hypothetical protein